MAEGPAVPGQRPHGEGTQRFSLPALISQFHKPRVSTPDEVSLITPVAARVWGLKDAGAGLQAGTQTSLVLLDRLVSVGRQHRPEQEAQDVELATCLGPLSGREKGFPTYTQATSSRSQLSPMLLGDAATSQLT